VFKKLDKLIIRAFIGPFIATFFITLLVLVMQFFWLYIDDFVGKGLGTGVILEFIWFQSAALVPLALPLAILLSSLMTFGNLGESFEFRQWLFDQFNWLGPPTFDQNHPPSPCS